MLNLKIALRWLWSWPLNIIGFLGGFATCMHCMCSWLWAKEKDIPYSKSGGMFPLCKLCFNNLSTERVIEYANKLVDKWMKPGSPNHNGVSWDELRTNAESVIRFMKGETNELPFEGHSMAYFEYYKVQ